MSSQRRTAPASVRTHEGRLVVTDAAGGEFDFRGDTLAALTHTAVKLEAEAKCAAKKAAYLRAALLLLPSEG